MSDSPSAGADPARAAAIDIGTNSVLLTIGERRGDAIVTLVDRATITRLGQGVDKARALAPEAVERTLACLARYAEEIKAAGVDRIDAVGTSAMRDALGGESFRERAAEILGVAPRVVSGDEEARLTFSGALTGLGLAPSPVMVFDVGGGSTEIIRGVLEGSSAGSVSGNKINEAVSLDIGSVRLTERHIHHDPPQAVELEAARADASSALSSLSFAGSSSEGGAPSRIVGVAGTVTTLAALVLDVAPYDGTFVHGSRIQRSDVIQTAERLASLSLSERRSLRALDPARADVIVAGSILVSEVLAWASASELIVSDRGVRWGLLHNLLDMAKKA